MRRADGRQVIGHTVANRAESLVSDKAILERPVVSHYIGGSPNSDMHHMAAVCGYVKYRFSRSTLSTKESVLSDFEAVPALQVHDRPCGIQDTLPTLRPSCSAR
jgi:hypothetical protein